ncbi:hypothetical protein D3C86_2035100 [compost metagenome]
MLNNRLGDLTRIALGNFGQLHGGICSQIAMGLVFRHFQHDCRKLFLRYQAGGKNSTCDGLFHPFIGKLKRI